MDRHTYFQELKELARQKRLVHGVDTASFGLAEIRKIYKAEGIKIDQWPLPRKIKAIYMCSDKDYSVAVQKTLPKEPKLFALAHELKHHYVDQELITAGVVHCGDYNANEIIEIGAEVFAAEFIYPELEFALDIKERKVQNWAQEDIVHLKRECKAQVSYQFILKRLEHLKVIGVGQFKSVKFLNLEYQIYGLPFHLRNKRRQSTHVK